MVVRREDARYATVRAIEEAIEDRKKRGAFNLWWLVCDKAICGLMLSVKRVFGGRTNVYHEMTVVFSCCVEWRYSVLVG